MTIRCRIALLTLLTSGLLMAADPPKAQDRFGFPPAPTTSAEWKHIKGTIFEVDLHPAECETRIFLKQGEKMLIIPNPEDKWHSKDPNYNNDLVTFRGDMSQPPGMTKQLQVKVYPNSGVDNGPIAKPLEKAASWVDVVSLPNGVWKGPGMIVLRGQLFNAPGTGEGVIRVKLVRVP